MPTKRRSEQLYGWFDDELAWEIERRRQGKKPITFYELHQALRRAAPGLALLESKAVIDEYCRRLGIDLPLGPAHLSTGVVRGLVLVATLAAIAVALALGLWAGRWP